MPFYKYRTDLGNTVTAKSSTSFSGLLGNEAQISSTIDTPKNQPLYLYKVSGGLLVDNDDTTINNALSATGIVVNASPTYTQFTGYTATTAPSSFVSKAGDTMSGTLIFSTDGSTDGAYGRLKKNVNYAALEVDGKEGLFFNSPYLVNNKYSGYTGSFLTIGQNGMFTLTSLFTGTTSWQTTNGITAIPANTPTNLNLSTTPNIDVNTGTLEWNVDVTNSNNQEAFVSLQLTVNGVLTGTSISYVVAKNASNKLFGSIPVSTIFHSGNVLNLKITSNKTLTVNSGLLKLTASGMQSVGSTVTANNGITKNGNNIRLGGVLTGSTTITSPATGSRLSFAGFPIQYSTDVSGNYNIRSLVDRGYVTGITSTLATQAKVNTYTGTTAPATYQSKTSINTYTGTTAPAQFAAKTNFNVYTGTTAPATYQSKVSINTYTGTTAPATFANKATFNTYTGTTIAQATNGLTRSGINVKLGGNLTGATTIGLGANILTFTGTSGTLRYGSDLSAQYNARSIVDKGFVTGITSTLVTQAKINTYTGTTAPATYQSKASIVILTGTTLPATYQSKSSINIYTGTTAPAQFAAKSNFNTYTGTTVPATYLTKTVFNSYTGSSVGISSANNGLTKNGTNVRLGGSLTGATTITSPATGSRLSFAGFPIQYSTDLSANYNARSVVDKGFVTGNTQNIITFRENSVNLNTAPTQFNIINFTSGTTAIDKGSGILEIQTIHGSEVFNSGRTTTATNGTATFIDYLAKTFTLAGGTYKIEYTCKAGIGTANTNLGVQLLIDGVAMESGTNNLYRNPNAGARIMVSTFTVRTLTAGSHSFRVQFSASSGTATADYGWILITRIG